MFYPNLKRALDEYCSALQSSFKSGIQVRTGALRDSIRVQCVIDDTSYSLEVSLLDYWKYLVDPLPLSEVYDKAGLQPPVLNTRYPQSNSRYNFPFDQWSLRLNEAFELDIRAVLNEL